MTDDLPDDLIDRLVAAVEGVCCRTCAEEALAALAEWADGALIDPDGWRRLDARTDDAGIDYCTAHTGLRNEDEGVCDMVSLADLCPECGGDETVRCQDRECEPDDGDHHEHYIQCPSCDGLGVTPCALVPLHTLTPRETTP